MWNPFKLVQIKQLQTTAFHGMGSGLLERFNQTLLGMLGTLTTEKKKAWPNYIADL